MRVLVISDTIESAIEKLKEVVEVYENNKGEWKTSYRAKEFEADNGNFYKTILANESAKGHRAEKIYVSKNVSKEILDVICIPMLIKSKLEDKECLIYF